MRNPIGSGSVHLQVAWLPAALLLHVATTLTAQCQAGWSVEQGNFGVSGQVAASTLWDPDGTGPLGSRIVVAGSFGGAGNDPSLGWTVSVNSVASFDVVGHTWAPLGSLASIVDLASSPGGGLYAATGNAVYSWDGAAWQMLGSGMNGPVHAITVLTNGDVLAGGAFTNAGGVVTNGFARWDGTSWLNPGLGVPAVGRALTTLANGHVIAAGSFTVGGVAAEYVARWNGFFWTMLGSSINGVVHSVAGVPNGDIVAAGDFTAIGAVAHSRVARWNGSAWQAMGTGMDATVRSVVALAGGDVIAGGAFTLADGGIASHIARWNGSNWQPIRSGMEADVCTLTVLSGGTFLAGGDFTFADRVSVYHVALWDGSAFQTVGSGRPTMANTHAMTFLPNGDMVVAGDFDFGSNGVRRIARWDGTSWQAFGSGMDGTVRALAVLPTGDLVAGGSFSTAGGVAANMVARWDGNVWQPLGGGVNGTVRTLLAMPSGELVAGGDFTSPGNYLAQWDGSVWQQAGAGANGSVNALAKRPNGDLVVGGSFSWIGGISTSYLAIATGGVWTSPGGGVTYPVQALAIASNGDVVAGCSYYPGWVSTVVNRWNGTSWLGMGSFQGWLHTLVSLPNGDLLAGGDQFSFQSLYRYSSGNWAPWHAAGGVCRCLLVTGSADVHAAGDFHGPAHYQTTCPASITAIGVGCVGSSGVPTTTFSPSPWVGLTSESRTTNLGPNAMAFEVFGFSDPNTALSTLTPLAGSGCILHAYPDLSYLLFPFGGEVTAYLTLPNDMAFAGIALYHQVVQMELDQQFNTIAVSTSNAMRLVTGSF